MEAWLEKSKVYRNDFRRQALAAELQSQFAEQDKATGRSRRAHGSGGSRHAVRVMGKASFVTETSAGRFSVI